MLLFYLLIKDITFPLSGVTQASAQSLFRKGQLSILWAD